MEKKITGLSKAPIYSENPFIDQMLDEIKIKHKTQSFKTSENTELVMMNLNDGEIVEKHTAVLKKIEVDETQFRKIYTSQIGALWNLSKAGIRLFSYLIEIMKPNDDRVFFDLDDCMKYCKWTSKPPIYKGLMELIDAKIIARTKHFNLYYVNPSIVFNGSRVTFITTYTKRKKEENPNQTKLDFGQIEDDWNKA